MVYSAQFEEHTRLSFHDMIQIFSETLVGFEPRRSSPTELFFRVSYTRVLSRNHEETYEGYLAVDGEAFALNPDNPALSEGTVDGLRIRIGGERIRIETPELQLSELVAAVQSEGDVARLFTDQNWRVRVSLDGDFQTGGELLPYQHHNVPKLDSVFIGGEQDDTLVTGRGQDTLRGKGGDDTLSGREGADELRGGAGDDTLSGGYGSDTLNGGGDDDDLDGGAGSDILLGGGGDDVLRGSSGGDHLRGGAGNDRFFGGGGGDTIVAGAGYDYIYTSFHHTHGDDVFVFSDNDDLNIVRSTRGRYNKVDLSRVSEITDFQDLVDNHVTFYDAGEYVPPEEHRQGYEDLMSASEFSGAVIDDGSGTIILLSGYHRLAHFTEDSLFIF